MDSGHGGRYHLVRAPAGQLTVRYEASVRPHLGWRPQRPTTCSIRRSSRTSARAGTARPTPCSSFATAELGRAAPTGPDRATAVAAWVFERVAYDIDATAPLDGAVETLLSGRGVCRDFAHLTVALCRALEIPARLVAVYAPGLSPMDFHAVAEALVQGEWQVLDATRLAPRARWCASPPAGMPPTPPSPPRCTARPSS